MATEIQTRQADGDDLTPVAQDNPLAVTLASAGGGLAPPVIAVGGDSYLSTASFVRPSDSTQYAVADAVANSTTASAVVPLRFGGAARATGGGGYLVSALLKVVVATATITSGSFRLHLFSTPPATLWADNAAMNLLFADTAGYLFSLDVTLRSEGGSATLAWAYDDARRSLYVCAPGDTALYGLMAAEGTYTPTAAQMFAWTLGFERNP